MVSGVPYTIILVLTPFVHHEKRALMMLYA